MRQAAGDFMEMIDEQGVFWISGREEDCLSGRLVFDPSSDDGIRVSLVGVFTPEPPDGLNQNLHGVIKNREVTLADCITMGRSQGVPGAPYSAFVPNHLFIGRHLVGEINALEFDSVSVELSDLSAWVGFDGITEEWNHDSATSAPLYKIEFDPVEMQSHRFDRGLLSISQRWESDGGGSDGRAGIRHWPAIKLSYDSLQPFGQIHADVRKFQDLLTLCVDRRTNIDRMTVSRADVKACSISGVEFEHPQPVDYMAPPLRYISPDKRSSRHAHQMFLTLQELGGVSVVARWMDRSPQFHRSLMSMMSVHHARHMYTENRFLNIAFAAESFHRELYDSEYMEPSELDGLVQSYLSQTPPEYHDWLVGKLRYSNALPFRRRLQELVRLTQSGTKALIRNRNYWAQLITQVRNDLTHLKGDVEQFEGRDLHFLAESVFAVLRFCMLLEVGVSREVLAEKTSTWPANWYYERLSVSIREAAAVVERNKHAPLS